MSKFPLSSFPLSPEKKMKAELLIFLDLPSPNKSVSYLLHVSSIIHSHSLNGNIAKQGKNKHSQFALNLNFPASSQETPLQNFVFSVRSPSPLTALPPSFPPMFRTENLLQERRSQEDGGREKEASAMLCNNNTPKPLSLSLLLSVPLPPSL